MLLYLSCQCVQFSSSVIVVITLSVYIASCGDRCCVLVGGSMDPQHLFHLTASNIICSLIFGERFEYDDPVILTLIQRLEELTKEAFGPWAMVQSKPCVTPCLLKKKDSKMVLSAVSR